MLLLPEAPAPSPASHPRRKTLTMKIAMKRSRSCLKGHRDSASPSWPSQRGQQDSLDSLPHFSPSGAASSSSQQQQQQQQQKVILSPEKRNDLPGKENSSSLRESASLEKRRGSPSGSACSKDTQAAARMVELDRKKQTDFGPIVANAAGKADRIRLKDVASGSVQEVAECLHEEPYELLEELKADLREILGGTGGIHQREEFALLQKIVLNRTDLSPELLTRANRTQLEILVAIKTGIQAFLHPDIAATQSVLIEIFFYRRCRNMACQNQLPGDECPCEFCNAKNGFCKACMCTICSKFDFDVNTCRWIGCDFCSHWTHTDCAIRVGQISVGPSFDGPAGATEMLYGCNACKRSSELIGWVKEVFLACSTDWGRDELMKEFDSVRRIFHGSKDSKGKRLFWKCEELLESLKTGVDSSTLREEMHRFFQELKAEDANAPKGIAKPIELHEGFTELKAEDANAPKGIAKLIELHEACSRIAEMVEEAVRKMESVSEEKVCVLKKTLVAIESCDRELEEKRRQMTELQIERQQKKRDIEELEAIVKLKQAEAEMFQLRADEAHREAESLQRIVTTKSEKVEEEYMSRYLKLRLSEAEAQRRYLFEKIQLEEHCRLHPVPSQMLMLYKIKDLLKSVQNDTVLWKNNQLNSHCANGKLRCSFSADEKSKSG